MICRLVCTRSWVWILGLCTLTNVIYTHVLVCTTIYPHANMYVHVRRNMCKWVVLVHTLKCYKIQHHTSLYNSVEIYHCLTRIYAYILYIRVYTIYTGILRDWDHELLPNLLPSALMYCNLQYIFAVHQYCKPSMVPSASIYMQIIRVSNLYIPTPPSVQFSKGIWIHGLKHRYILW
jgi:hypothetical protein